MSSQVDHSLRLMLSVSLAVALTALAGCRPSSEQEDQRQILRLEQVLVDAWNRHDVSALEPIVADDMQYWTFTGKRRGKADLLRAVRESREVGGGTAVTDAQVRLYGDTAIYSAQVADSLPGAGGTLRTSRTCVTDVFHKRGRNWMLVASHESLLPEAPAVSIGSQP